MYEPHERDELAGELSQAFLAAPWRAEALAEEGAARLDRWPSWMPGLALSVVAVQRTRPVGRRGELHGLITAFLAEHAAHPEEPRPPRVVREWSDLLPAGYRPRAPAPSPHWAVAEIDSVTELARMLELSEGQLAWLADVRGLERTVADERLRNYRYRALPRRNGPPRVIESPKARLKEIQRWVLREILDRVAAHEAAHGFTRGRSVITHAREHTAARVVLRLDLRDFFASVPAARVFGIFRSLGYRRTVAHALTGLTTNVVPATAWDTVARTIDAGADGTGPAARFRLGRRLATPHLPQGAPTSPALANLAAFRLDRRLTGLATALDLRYSRYADDITLSGSIRLARINAGLIDRIAEIARSEGFALNERKSALRTAADRQTVCGVVVNARPNVPRTEYDALRAILHNAAHHGVAGQNRAGVPDFRSHLLGRIAWVAQLNPARGRRLREALERIDWDV
ncbi:MAG: reverse transcriptase family protein [Solirubrobacteraceae bacterium]